MARTRVFISSTYYDLKQVRNDLEAFVKTIGYDPILHESGNIPYGVSERLENYCYKEISNSDIVICILGGRYGSESIHGGSITSNELKKAILDGKQVYIFIEKSVYAEYHIWRENKNVSEFKLVYGDDKKIYETIESIYSLQNNNQIKEFEKSSDIIQHLKEQWSGLFQRLLTEESKKTERNIIDELNSQLDTLKTFITLFKDTNNKTKEVFDSIYFLKNKFLDKFKKIFKIEFNVYIKSYNDIDSLLIAKGYEENPFFLGEYVWEKKVNDKEYRVIISEECFDENKALKYNIDDFFKDDMLKLEVKEDEFPF